jgi:hypothetical protein
LGERSSTTQWRVFWVASLSSTLGTGRKLDDSDKEKVKDAVAVLADLCKKIRLTTSLELLKAPANDLPQIMREVGNSYRCRPCGTER